MLNSLRARVLVVVVLALVPTFLLLVIAAEQERRAGVARALESARSTAKLVADQQATLIGSADQMIGFITSLMDRPVTHTEQCDASLTRLVAGTDDYLGMSIADADGTVQCITPPLEPGAAAANIRDRAFFQRAVRTRAFAMGGFQLARRTGRPALTFAAPVIDKRDQITAVVAAGIDLLALNERLEGAELPADIVVFVTDEDGVVLARHPDPAAWIGQPISNTALLDRLRSQREGTAQLTDPQGDARWHAFTTVGDPASDAGVLYVDVSYPEEGLFAFVDARLRRSVLSLILGGIVAMMLAWTATSVMITHNLGRLTGVARRLSSGDWSARTGLRDGTDLGRLALAFDEMADTLQAHERDLRTLNAELEDRVTRRSASLERTNARLRDSRTELRRLSRELVDVAEQERARLSREVHDQIGQALTSIKMDVSSARRRLQKAEVEGADERLTSAIGLVDETIRLVRRIALDLRPSVLDDFGLAAAVEWHVEDVATRAGLTHQLDANVDEQSIQPALATATYRILQESLVNVVRHAHGKHVDVRLRTSATDVTLVVRDDGRGITPDEQRGEHSLGLLGMRERARQLGGTLAVEGAAGAGTTVTLVLPLVTPDTEEDTVDEDLDR